MDDKSNDEQPNMLVTALPTRPGTHLPSKLLLRDPYIKNIVIDTVVGKGVHGDAYHVGSGDRHDGRKTDVVYLPYAETTDDLPPVIVEVQQKVTEEFVLRIIRYCIDILEETKVTPILVIFNIDNIIGKQFFEKTFAMGQAPYYTQDCHPWARSVYLYNADSIAAYATSTPLQPIVALASFFTQQQRDVLALDVFDDPSIGTIYQRAYAILSKHHAIVTDQQARWQHFCRAIALQFDKIAKATRDDLPNSKKRVIKYAEDGVSFSNKLLRLCSDEDDPGNSDTTPIELENRAKSDDLLFVERFRSSQCGRFSWQQCYDRAKEENERLFTRYKSYLSLRQAFYEKTL